MAIKDLNPEQLRDYIEKHHEKDYLLIDVRQPGEYQVAHIPGARLIPLPELAQSVDTLPADKELVFYCHSGGRSSAAAAMADEEMPVNGDIYNLDGGMLAWDGGRVADLPNVRLFAGQSGPEMLETAMNLEKGALRFYAGVGERFATAAWIDVFDKLSKAEEAHARIVHGHWRKHDESLASFEDVFARMDGDVLEGGMPLADALEKLAEIASDPCIRLIEMALKIEYAAFDLYRSMAHQAAGGDARDTFLALSQSEKAHMRSLIQAIALCGDSAPDGSA